MGFFDHQSYDFGRGPGFLGTMNPGNNLPKFQRDIHQARSEFLLYLRRSYGNEVALKKDDIWELGVSMLHAETPGDVVKKKLKHLDSSSFF